MPLFWQTILSWSGQEQKIFNRLEKASVPVFWPRWAIQGQTERCLPFASGYIFVSFDASDPTLWHGIKDTCGSAFLGFIGGASPISVEDKAFDYLRKNYNADINGLMLAPIAPVSAGEFKENDAVLMKGVFEGLIGRVLWSNKQGTKIIFKIFGRDSEVFVPSGMDILKKISEREVHRLLGIRVPQFGRYRRRDFSPLRRETFGV